MFATPVFREYSFKAIGNGGHGAAEKAIRGGGDRGGWLVRTPSHRQHSHRLNTDGKIPLDLSRSDLQKVELGDLNLMKANLSHSSLRKAILERANLQGANLSDPNLQNALLMEAYLQYAPLWDADLQNAGLREPNLQGALFVGANLQGAKLKGANSPARFWRKRADAGR